MNFYDTGTRAIIIPMLHITEEDVLRLLPMSEAVRLVRESFESLATGSARNQARRRLHLPTGAVLHQLSGQFGNYFGCKIYSTHPKHGAHFLVLLYDAATAAPLALIDANHLGQIRTGAATGVATSLMANPAADTLAVIGSGFQARTQIEAILTVRPIREVRVWSRTATRRAEFAAACARDFNSNIVPADSAGAAVTGATIVVTATYAKDPVLEASWISPGAHINAIGSNNPQRREIPPDLIAAASTIATDSLEQARIESGDLLLAWSEADWQSPRLTELSQVAAGLRPARASTHDITLFKSNGLGAQDIAVAGYVFERMRA
ncbi:MAG: ornithine cyclodeaminase family protein [Acidobacteria bacterium]|nr:ornithine cyclodeaminase family protein [Acidobacteriota bacterium]